MTMTDLANHILYVADQNELPVTNLQLQKVMYFTLKAAINAGSLSEEKIKETYNTPFEVWGYGPVERDLYFKYRIYGADPIAEKGSRSEQFGVLDKKIKELLDKRPFDLVNISHREDFWQENKDKIKGWISKVPYDLSDVAAGQVI